MDDQTTPNNAAGTEQMTQGAEVQHPAAAAELPAGPEVVNGVKVYPTSFIPQKAVLHTPKKSLISMDLLHIEAIHIATFLFLTVFLFIGMWKRANRR